MLNKKLYPVMWSVLIVGAFMLGAATQSIVASSNLPARMRGELPEPNNVPSVVNATWLPREPQEKIRGGMAEAYTKPEQPATISIGTVRPAVHSEERLEQALSKYESTTAAGSVSDLPMPIRGGLAENGRLTNVPIASKLGYTPHSDAWNDQVLQRYETASTFHGGITERPAKMRGGPID